MMKTLVIGVGKSKGKQLESDRLDDSESRPIKKHSRLLYNYNIILVERKFNLLYLNEIQN